jgi:2-methylisocitrate lyase-like PEP mutase family enzyme
MSASPGRCESFLTDQPDLPSTITRLQAYGAAGAGCLYAPGMKDLGAIAQLVQVLDKPVNANLSGTGLSLADFAGVGVRRGQRRRCTGTRRLGFI